MQYRKPPSKKSTNNQKQTGKYRRFHECYSNNTNECRYLQNVIEKLIRKRKLQQFVKASQDGVQGTSDPNRGQVSRRAEEPAQTGGRLVINKIVEGQHAADKSSHEMERYASAKAYEC